MQFDCKDRFSCRKFSVSIKLTTSADCLFEFYNGYVFPLRKNKYDNKLRKTVEKCHSLLYNIKM